MRPAFEGDELAATGLGKYVAWLADRGQHFATYSELWAWSVEDLEGFWTSIWDHFEVPGSQGNCVLPDRTMPGASWFPTARLNYAETILGTIEDPDRVAIVGRSQARGPVELTFGELAEEVRRARAAFRSLGVRKGDRVVGYLPNIPEAVVAMLATVSLGATWACCPPEFGVKSVVDRLAQLEPRLLLAVSGYNYGAKEVDRAAELQTIRDALPTVENVVGLTYGVHEVSNAHDWTSLLAEQGADEPLEFEPVSFDHPLWTLFSSGTTGLPKAVVHSHGGITLEHLKLHALHLDTRSGDRVMLMSTTGWTVWNCMVSALMVGASIVVTDGNPFFPELEEPWRIAAETGVTNFGTSPGYLMACRTESVRPADRFDLSALRTLGVTGAVLPPEAYDWIYDVLPGEVYLNSMSGGTDICSNFVSGNAWVPVYRGELSAPALGSDVAAFNDDGLSVVNQVGELVVRAPMPSMPVAFWNDNGMERYLAAYFDIYPGIWRHGDWVTVSDRQSVVIQGRSDATLNRGGVRIGTAEFYNLVEALPEIQDSLVVHLEDAAGGPGELMLFVQLADGHEMNEDTVKALKGVIRKELSPRHVPDLVAAVPAVPRTLTGKKLETPIKKILAGAPPEQVVSPGSVTNYDAIEAYRIAALARA
ncbi:acetoacetate--CoA ligase [Nocardioides cavernaquae]|uniref:Acetoacetate--CoA ligase n=1 Tax=Nocardioides cavernaquae TaxID=2321396 RepID=A0A3A5H9S1_9ACTN|nr:acetoacetate--CoA ligase [Nocardioides cavernaquae]RJS46781.1 acetoacetate--CoA ligase [Nocardioides cavernaquae]